MKFHMLGRSTCLFNMCIMCILYIKLSFWLIRILTRVGKRSPQQAPYRNLPTFYDCSLLQQFPLLIAWRETIGTHNSIPKKKQKRKTIKLRLKSVVVSVTRGIPFRIGWLGSLKGLWTRPLEGLIDGFFRWRQVPSQTCSILLRSWSCLFWGGIPLRESQECKRWRKLFPKKHAWWKITNSMPSIK